MITKQSRSEIRVKKHKKIRNKFHGTAERPRLSVFRSEKHIYAQVIDDIKGITLVAASSLDKDLALKVGSNKEAAQAVGTAIAKKAKAAGIEEVVFDRGGFIYHGRIQALADAAREAGLQF
jgi:large subunit ribosomal protein L18